MQNSANARNATLNNVMSQLGNRANEISNMLPQDLPMERFQANILNALRNTPAILDATVNSIIKACMKAAYDGLRLDGKEAAIVVHENTYGQGANQRKVKEAEYFPMAFGLIQQIYRGGEVRSMYAEVIREADEYEIRQGTNRGIHHVKNLEKPGTAIVAAYSVAELMNGGITFEVLDRGDLADIRGAAKTKKVWERWGGEMSKKSAIRRHRKTLPLGERDIVINDSEAADLYGQLDPGRESLPAPAQTERPTRAAIADRMGTENGAPLDLGHDEDGVVIEQEQAEDRQNGAARKGPAQHSEGQAEDRSQDAPAGEMPGTDEEWSVWGLDLEEQIAEAADADALNKLARDEDVRLSAAPKDLYNKIQAVISDRHVDFVTSGEG